MCDPVWPRRDCPPGSFFSGTSFSAETGNGGTKVCAGGCGGEAEQPTQSDAQDGQGGGLLAGGLAGMGSLLVVGLIVGFVVLKKRGQGERHEDESEDDQLEMENLNDGAEASEPF